MVRQLKCFIIFIGVSFLYLILFHYGLVMSKCSGFLGYQHNISYLLDEVKLLQPVEKKMYTPCPKAVEHNLTESLSKVILMEDTVNRTRTKWQKFILNISDYPLGLYSGKGIVSSASSGFNRHGRLIASLKLLRWLKCRLPIEVFMYPGELKEEEIREFQTILYVTVRVLTYNITLASEKHSPYAIKIGAILQSSFEHVLWLDSDNIPVRDPDYLFDLPHYTRSTAIFWPDFWSTPRENPIWRILNIPCRAEDYEQESGQILVNKRLAWKAINSALYLTSDPIFLQFLFGDKDAFRFSWKALTTPFYFIRKFLSQAGFDYVKSAGKNLTTIHSKFCGHTMVQYDPFGEILFLHANLVKGYPSFNFPIEKNHISFMEQHNPWRILRRYANSAPYFRPRLFNDDGFLCMTFVTDSREHLRPIIEDDFHNYISANITAKYLSYLNGSIIASREPSSFDVVERNWGKASDTI